MFMEAAFGDAPSMNILKHKLNVVIYREKGNVHLCIASTTYAASVVLFHRAVLQPRLKPKPTFTDLDLQPHSRI